MKLFAQIRKVDEAKRIVYGRIAQEVVDKADEIMDYESSKPYFKAWSAEVQKDSDGKSLGNVRAMHGKVAAGKLVELDFIDAEKAIDVGAKVVDDTEWKKVLEGVYTGFSIGGRYVGDGKTEKMADGKEVRRYTAAPHEVSLVDRPCIPTATFFEIQKADGSLAKVAFKEPTEEKVEPTAEVAKSEPQDQELTVNGTPEEVDALVKFMAEHKLTMADVLAKVVAKREEKPAEEPKEVIKKTRAELRKSMWSASSFAQIIANLQSLMESAEWEAYYEGDESSLPKRIGACVALCGQVLKEMIDEELAEIAEGTEAPAMVVELSQKLGGLAKRDEDPLITLIKYGARHSSTDKERLDTIHKMAVEMGAECGSSSEKVQKAEAVSAEAIEKALTEKVVPLQKALEEAVAKIAKLEAQPAPTRIALRAVSKGDDAGELGAKPIEKAEPIVDAHGEAHDAAGLIKNLHKNGGLPLTQHVFGK